MFKIYSYEREREREANWREVRREPLRGPGPGIYDKWGEFKSFNFPSSVILSISVLSVLRNKMFSILLKFLHCYV